MSGKFLSLLSSIAALAIVSGCTSTDMSSAFSTKKKEDLPVNAATTPVVVQGQCPQVYLRDGTAVYTQYSKQQKRRKKTDDPAPAQDPNTLVMQASLDQTTRQCFQTDQGSLRITVVVHGRLVLGPAGQPGSSFTLPIRVAATDGDQTLYSELTKFTVALPPGQSTTQFVFTKENVVLTDKTQGGLARLFAGIDEGPYNTK